MYELAVQVIETYTRYADDGTIDYEVDGGDFMYVGQFETLEEAQEHEAVWWKGGDIEASWIRRT